MRFGVCASMIAPAADPIGIASVEAVAAMGFDYIELSLAHLAALPDGEFEQLAERVLRSGVRCEACNNFFPPRVRLTGPEADPRLAADYAAAALARAARLGVEIVVLGSSGAKNVPAGFPHEQAREQLLDLLYRLAPLAASHDITIVLEPISRPEANFINLAAEALELVRAVSHPGVRLLVDYYHLVTEAEDAGIMRAAGALLRHVHFACPAGRSFPTGWDPQYEPFFAVLSDIDYGGRLSVEAFTRDFAGEGAGALAVLRAATAPHIR